MKKILFSALVLGLAFSGCKKDDDKEETAPLPQPAVTVPQANNSLLQKFTGTKCPPCGAWGWTMMEELSTYAEGKAFVISTYSQNFVAEGFITQTSSDMDVAWSIGNSGYPTFTVNAVPQLDRGSTVNTANEKAKCQTAMDNHKAAPVVANVGIAKSISGSTMTIKTSTQFFQAASGDYNLAIYVTEDGAMWKQSGHATGASTAIPHHHVMRGAVNGTWGELIMNGSIAAGSFKDKSFTFSLDPSWNAANIEVVAVLWKKNSNGKYDFVNANGIQN